MKYFAVGGLWGNDVQPQPVRAGLDEFLFMGMKVAGNDLATIFHRNRRSEGLSSGGGTAVQHPHAGDGACGEDGRIQATLDLLGIPYTGSGCLGSAIAMDKDMTKRIVADLVRTPAWRTVTVTEENLEQLMKETKLPVVVKPIASGSSIGVTIAHTQEELRRGLEESITLGGRTVLEQYIKGREIQVAVLNDKPLPSIEIIPQADFYDYENKYQPGAALEVCPAQIPAEWEEEVGKAAVTVFQALGLAVYARADFIVTPEGEAYFLEINTLPGMTPTSLVPQEAAAVGMDYPALCETIVESSLKARKEGA